jgi:hypothetical protein
LFLDGYHPVDLEAEKVGNVKDYLLANGVVGAVSPNDIAGKEFVSEALIPFMISAREFWLQLNPATVDALMTQIDEISAQGELAIPSRVEVGSFYLARYPDDDRPVESTYFRY